MRCTEIQEQLSTYDYGGLTGWSRWRIGRHLARCPDCVRELAALRRTAEMLATAPERAAPDNLWERVWEGMETEKARRRQELKAKPRIVGWRWAPAGAAVVAVSLVAFGLFWFFAPAPPTTDVFDNPTPYVRYHHLLSQQEVLADAAGLDVLAVTAHQGSGSWEQGG